MNHPVHEIFGNQVRIRACGLCVQNNQLLLVNHSHLAPGDFWAPPGGGVRFSEALEAALQREFEEETGLRIQVRDFLFVCEFIQAPLHAIELFWRVEMTGGAIRTGIDPELGDTQIIQAVQFFDWNQINALPKTQLHGIFRIPSNPAEILDLRGYFKL